jgi:tetratricopeptide (TPR) repeat protein
MPELVEGIWAAKSVKEERFLKMLEWLEISKPAAQVLPVRPLLDELHGAGLLSREGEEWPKLDLASVPAEAQIELGGHEGEAEERPYAFHELVRERIAHWMSAHPEERAERTEAEIWQTYGERYGIAFQVLRKSRKQGAMERAAEAGSRALTYLARASAFDLLADFARDIVTSTSNPALLGSAIVELQAVMEQMPAGQNRWRLRGSLADALFGAGRAEESLPFFQLAATEAEAAGHWSDVVSICNNWAAGLQVAGYLSQAKRIYLWCAEAKARAGHERVDVIGSELEALRIDLKEEKAAQALPEIEKRLNEVRCWWKRHQAGESVPEAPDAVVLYRALVSGLSIAGMANEALQQWQACLALVQESEQAKQEIGESELELTRTRVNQCRALIGLHRLHDAQLVIESCLSVFRDHQALGDQAKALSLLAGVWDARGDIGQAVALERQTLALNNGLPNFSHRATSHHNLATYLAKSGQFGEASRHRLASIIYDKVTGQIGNILTGLQNLAQDIRRAAQSSQRYELPRLSDLLAAHEFDPLKQFLTSRRVDLEQLQSALDQIVEKVRQQLKSDRG